MSTSGKKPDSKKAENDIRVGMRSVPRYVIKYASSIMKEKKFKELKFSAVGGSICKLVQVVEVLKVLIPDLYQQNLITSVAYQNLDLKIPKLEVILSTEQFKEKTEGYQEKLSEKDRKTFEDLMNKRREEREKNRGNRRRRGGFRGRGRGFRGRRGGFRGNRGLPRRGGFRGNRGATRGNQRGRGRGQRGGAQQNRGRGK